MLDGSVPLMELLLMSILVSAVSCPIVLGIVPTAPMELSELKCMNTVDGIVGGREAGVRWRVVGTGASVQAWDP